MDHVTLAGKGWRVRVEEPGGSMLYSMRPAARRNKSRPGRIRTSNQGIMSRLGSRVNPDENVNSKQSAAPHAAVAHRALADVEQGRPAADDATVQG